MLVPEAATPGRAAVRRSVAGNAGGGGSAADDDVEAASAQGAGGSGECGAECAPAGGDGLASALSSLLLPVYLPRAILSTGSGLCLVARPLFARHLGCNDTQTGLIAAAVPLARAPPARACSAPLV